ncbi:hypothetical protein KIN34_08950 [Cellulomonas sp. DKR-3]|uniref:Uncharacterized protein n=1 Tax=Cellulomonas fulva TaxID=2835530 RepID=A0ABS5TZ18_9CELL|nr:hypothetical protein [Cellulomonas fulva]MBT0994412.1 hypothetical protein [Cellulomonas fulva]
MSQFTPSAYTAATTELRSGLALLDQSAARLESALESALSQWWVADALADGLRWCVDRLSELARATATRIRELAQGIAAPLRFYFQADDWTDVVASPASVVAATVAPDALRAPLWWSGDAADRYQQAVAGQSPAAQQMAEVGRTASRSLATCAVAGCAFYLALGWVVAKLVATSIAAIGLLGSAVFSWAGLALVVEQAAVSAALVSAAVAALVATQTAAADAVVEVGAAAGSGTAFPNGVWPRGTA